MSAFTGFTEDTFAFLRGIAAHNEKAWFDANKALYEQGCVAPAKLFISDLGPRLRTIAPDVRFEPRVNGSIWRINRDVRFSKDKRPYKDHFDMMFWHGERKAWEAPGFWIRLTASDVHLGVGMFGLEKEQLAVFRDSIIHPRSGKALVAACDAVTSAGPYTLGGKTRKLMPRGYEAPEGRAEFMLFEGLYAETHMPVAAALRSDFVEVVFAHYSAMWPIGQWLMTEVAA